MPIKRYHGLPLKVLLKELEEDRIQMLMIPDGGPHAGFYSISMDGEDFIVTEGAGGPDDDFDSHTRKLILKTWDRGLDFDTIEASTGTELGRLMERYEKRYQ